MSQSRVIVRSGMAAMTALVVNSTVGYLAGREPAIFCGPAYAVLIAVWLVCVIVWIAAERDYRHDLRARTDDYEMAVRLIKWRLTDPDSGSWRRPPLN